MVFKTQEAIVMLHSALVMLVLDSLSTVQGSAFKKGD